MRTSDLQAVYNLPCKFLQSCSFCKPYFILISLYLLEHAYASMSFDKLVLWVRVVLTILQMRKMRWNVYVTCLWLCSKSVLELYNTVYLILWMSSALFFDNIWWLTFKICIWMNIYAILNQWPHFEKRIIHLQEEQLCGLPHKYLLKFVHSFL